MKLNLTPAKTDVASTDVQLGWLNMPAFGSGFMEFMSRDLGGDDFEPAAALSDEANEALAELPLDETADEGWAAVANRFQNELRTSFWSTISSVVELRPGHAVPALV